MRVIIAEKKNMAEDIARAMSSQVRPAQGYFDCGSFAVTWCSGHLLEQCEPDVYLPETVPKTAKGKKIWRVEDLPIIPPGFAFRQRVKVGQGQYADQAKRQIEAIRGLLAKANGVIHAGDPDREGQLIVDEVLTYLKNKAPVQRLWLHAQTDEGIKDAFKKLKSNNDYLHLYHAAMCRQEADWIVGMNCTRGWTLLWQKKGHQGVANVGRVKTPTLGLVYERDEAIRNFVPKDYYTITARVKVAKGEFNATWLAPKDAGAPAFDESGRLLDQEMAKAIAKATKGASGTITRVDKARRKEAAPLLPSLSDVQRAAGKAGYSPDEALAALQDLYDKHKVLTYPRTDCRYAPVSELAKAPRILAMLAKAAPNLLPWGKVESARKSAAWDDAKLGAHFAVIPTGKPFDLDALPKRERDVISIVLRLYAAQFLPPYEFESTIIEATFGANTFKAQGKVPLAAGWKVAFGGAAEASDDEGEEGAQTLPACSKGDAAQCPDTKVAAKKTKPLPHYTAETLVDAMENAHRYVHDPAVKKMLKQVEGIGTSATRGSIIKKLVKGKFLDEIKIKRGLEYRITDKGRALIQALPNLLKRVDFTALLEGKLEDVHEGRMTMSQFRGDLKALIDRVVTRMKDGSALAEIPVANYAQAPARPTGPSRSTGKGGAHSAGKGAGGHSKSAAGSRGKTPAKAQPTPAAAARPATTVKPIDNLPI